MDHLQVASKRVISGTSHPYRIATEQEDPVLKTARADSKFIWMQGELTRYEQATVPLLSHSLHYGGAAFEGIRAYETARGSTAIFRPQDHFRRFLDSMRMLDYVCPYGVDDLVRATRELVKANEFTSCYIRPLGYLDDGLRGLHLPSAPQALIAIAAWKWGTYMGDEAMEKGIRIGVSSFRRADISSSLPMAKLSGNYLTSVLARREASRNGFEEALLLDQRGYVAEGSGENLFVVKNGVLITPPAGAILPGITRDCVIRIARDLGYSVVEAHLTRNELYYVDEAFFTGTAVELTPIREIDHYTIASGTPGPITRALKNRFFQATRGEIPEYRDWLVPV